MGDNHQIWVCKDYCDVLSCILIENGEIDSDKPECCPFDKDRAIAWRKADDNA